MIALSLLFLFIIGLLGVTARMLQLFFDGYLRLQVLDPVEIGKLEKLPERRNGKGEADYLISDRLAELHRRFPDLSNPSEENDEMDRFTMAFKKMLESSLNLMKIKEQDH